MIEIIQVCIITSLFCNGLKIATGEGMILEFVKVYLNGKFIKKNDTLKKFTSANEQDLTVSKLYYPILYCIKCMPSIYGTLMALIFLPFSLNLIWQIPIVVICSVCLNAIFYHLYE